MTPTSVRSKGRVKSWRAGKAVDEPPELLGVERRRVGVYRVNKSSSTRLLHATQLICVYFNSPSRVHVDHAACACAAGKTAPHHWLVTILAWGLAKETVPPLPALPSGTRRRHPGTGHAHGTRGYTPQTRDTAWAMRLYYPLMRAGGGGWSRIGNR